MKKLLTNFGNYIGHNKYLRRDLNQSCRYFYSPVLPMPVLISNRADIDALINRLITMDILDSQIRRNDTKYIFKQVANIVFMSTEHTMPWEC